MHRIFILTGKSSSGKDTIYKKLLGREDLPLKKVVPYTTRPVRAGEKDGEAYHFCSEEEYFSLKESGKIIEARAYDTVFGTWYYFTADDGQIDLEKASYLMIGTPQSCISIRDYFGEEAVLPVYIHLDDGERLARALKRERKQEKPAYEEMCRRFLADAADFSEEKLAEAGIRDRFENTDLEECTGKIAAFIREKTSG